MKTYINEIARMKESLNPKYNTWKIMLEENNLKCNEKQ